MLNFTPGSTRRVLLDTFQHLAPCRRGGYRFHKIQVPPDSGRVGLTFDFHKEKLAQLYVSLHAPDGFRGNVMKPGVKGDVHLELWVGRNDASEGGLPGPLPEGEWTVQINIERLTEETDYRLVAYIERDATPVVAAIPYPEHRVVVPAAGWYGGELHAHSTESDGEWPVSEMVRAASDVGLDFLSLTDHFTVSQWRKMALLPSGRPALIRASEITSHIGHANLHGIREWVNVYVDQPGWDMNQAADAVHTQGGLFCVNHPYSGDLCFRAFDFDWHKADLLEIFHSLEGCNNTPQLGWWDHLLLTGHRIVGVAGTDSHHPHRGLHALGKLRTWVYADELSEQGILAGLRRGRVTVDRGCELRFSAVNAARRTAEMWETLPADGEPVTFRLQVKSSDPLRLYIIRDGLLMDHWAVENSPEVWTELTFSDRPDKRSYYRVELHLNYAHPDYPGVAWRDYTTFRAAGNPIFVE